MKLVIMTSLIATAVAAFPALANTTIDGMSARPALATAGEPVSVTIRASDADKGICAFVINWGDEKSQGPIKTGRPDRTFPLTLQHTYDTPGTYKIRVYGKRIDRHLPCLGKTGLNLKVESIEDAMARAMTCPRGWAISSKNADGSFSCSPKKKGVTKPVKAIDCPAGTSYFVNNKALGCEKSP